MKALISWEIAKVFKEKTGISVVPLPPYHKLDNPVSSHADMLFCVLDNTIFCYEDYVKDNKLCNILKDLGYDIVFVSNECKKEYPYDISLNVLVMGKTIFCNKKYTSNEILEYAEFNGYTIKNIKQGYSACSTLVLDSKNAITSDPSVFNALIELKKNVLLIDNSNIELKGYNCGFVGGSTGAFNNKLYLFGELEYIQECDRFNKFVSDLDYVIEPILQGGVYDFGGVKFI